MISFEGGGRRLTARLIGGDFIRYRSRFPAEFGCRAVLPADLFTAAVRRVSLVAERTSPVRLTFGDGEVVIEAHTDGRARAAETVPAAFTGSEPAISFNPRYLLDGLAAAAVCGAGRPAPPGEAGRDRARAAAGSRLEFTSPAKPALITWAGYDTAPMDETRTRPSRRRGRRGRRGCGRRWRSGVPVPGRAAAILVSVRRGRRLTAPLAADGLRWRRGGLTAGGSATSSRP